MVFSNCEPYAARAASVASAARFSSARKRRIDLKNLCRRLGIIICASPASASARSVGSPNKPCSVVARPGSRASSSALSARRRASASALFDVTTHAARSWPSRRRISRPAPWPRNASFIAVAGNLAIDGRPFGGRRYAPSAGERAVDPAQDDQLLVGIVRCAKRPHQQRNCRPGVQTADAPHHELSQHAESSCRTTGQRPMPAPDRPRPAARRRTNTSAADCGPRRPRRAALEPARMLHRSCERHPLQCRSQDTVARPATVALRQGNKMATQTCEIWILSIKR